MYGFAHVEIPALDIKKAADFYSALFNWKLRKFYGDDYLMIALPDGTEIGGLTKVNEIKYQTEYIVYVEVEDCAATLAKAEKIGGTVVDPRHELPDGYGFIGKVKSPDGYCIGVWSKR